MQRSHKKFIVSISVIAFRQFLIFVRLYLQIYAKVGQITRRANNMKKILYIDDASSMRKLVKMVLGKQFDLALAENGAEGLSQLQTAQFDLIISDINMPIMNGLTFLQKARSLENYKFTPILMMTTEASPEMKSQGKSFGATGWLVKPFDPIKLPDIIRKLM